MVVTIAFILLTAAYLVGGIPFGVLVARRRGIDLREHGSGNIGATNAARTLGMIAGLVTLALDAAKGALAVWIAMHVTADPRVVAATGLAAILGHCFSPYLGFRGGKGVATTLGVFAVLAPVLALIGIGVWLAVAGKTKIVALGSLAGVGAAVVAAFVEYPELRAITVATFVLLVYTHRENLSRLLTRSD